MTECDVKLCCSVLQYVAVCGNVLQCVAMCCSVLQGMRKLVLKVDARCVAVCCCVLQCVAGHAQTSS